jgi:hypothetical protein
MANFEANKAQEIVFTYALLFHDVSANLIPTWRIQGFQAHVKEDCLVIHQFSIRNSGSLCFQLCLLLLSPPEMEAMVRS